MVKVDFCDFIADELLAFAVIIAKIGGKWIFCKHRERDTYEVPGGHREPGETILETARRELYEETGAIDFELKPICVYSVEGNPREGEVLRSKNYGMLYYAEVYCLEEELHSEIEKLFITDKLVDNWTYPLIQPLLIEEAKHRGIL